ncbi:hypothetical protein M408DRAFT_18227 [Serendipita vermifera MAFF 305830]|uniref:Cytochrome P450 n=1 Tax=Serendipita vermifera MAFF 305830 TaxID=933852 RepID=A0A0C3ASF0_SERVB|nr:hypothetical protein M408DRAFT_18227 [Serendipita vermifera MAFF 305830]
MWNPTEWLLYGTATLLLFTYWRYRKAVSMVSDFPGLRLLVSPMSPLGFLLPAMPYPLLTYPGFSFPWVLKHKGFFAKLKSDTVSICAGDGRAILFTADVPFITRMTSYMSREVFPKPVEEYKVLSYLGSNLVICEGESWRRQRRIGAPAFSKGMFERLWLDMRDIVREMVEEEKWMERTSQDYDTPSSTTNSGYQLKQGELLVPNVVDLTLRMALGAIARAGFGMDFDWEAESSFTRGCDAFGNPRRWHWWLVCLGWLWTAADVVITPIHHFYSPLFTTIPTFITAVPIYLWNSWIAAPLRWACGVTFFFLAELWTVFSRPTDADFNPRKIKVHEALHLVAKDSTIRLAIPAWMMLLPIRRMRRMRLAFSSLESELRRLAEERKAHYLRESLDQEQLTDGPIKDHRSDLLNNLVKASMKDGADLEKGQTGGLVSGAIQKGLTDEEIIGNTYIYFLAGHETTAHSLAWTLALLAAYPEYQDAAVEEINNVWPSASETIRLFPPVQMIPKVAAQDVSVTVQTSNVNNAASAAPPTSEDGLISEKKSYGAVSKVDGSAEEVGNQTTFAVKKGTIIFMHTPGVHYNPRYWDKPEVFDPNRFLRGYNKDAFIPFGVGHRACLGRKFSEVESVAMLVHLLRNYSVHLAPTSPDGSVDVAAARAKFSEATVSITLTPKEIPLIFRRRVHS